MPAACDEKGAAQPCATPATTSSSATERLRVLNREVVDRHIAGEDEEAALDAATIERGVVSVDRDIARRIEGEELRAHAVTNGEAFRDVDREALAGRAHHVDLRDRGVEACGAIHRK